MVVVGDAPFVSDSILDARAKARHPSHVRVVTLTQLCLLCNPLGPSMCYIRRLPRKNVLSTMVLSNSKCVITFATCFPPTQINRTRSQYTVHVVSDVFRTISES